MFMSTLHNIRTQAFGWCVFASILQHQYNDLLSTKKAGSCFWNQQARWELSVPSLRAETNESLLNNMHPCIELKCLPTFSVFLSFFILFFFKAHCVHQLPLSLRPEDSFDYIIGVDLGRSCFVKNLIAVFSHARAAWSWDWTARALICWLLWLGLRWNKEILDHAHCATQPIRAHPKGALKSCYVSSHTLPY